MRPKRKQLEEIIFGRTGFRRFLQDSPVLPDVWMAFGENPGARLDLLLTPTWGKSPGKIANLIDQRLKKESTNQTTHNAETAYNVSTVAVKMTFSEMIRVILPMTGWWNNNILKDKDKTFTRLIKNAKFRSNLITSLSGKALKEPDNPLEEGPTWDINVAGNHEVWGAKKPKLNPHLLWLVKLVGTILLNKKDEENYVSLKEAEKIIGAFVNLMTGIRNVTDSEEQELVFSINLNRKASAMIWRSTNAVKADAARRLFEVDCKNIRWAIIDSGIDAKHPAFRLRDGGGKIFKDAFTNENGETKNMTRILKTYDFTLIRRILSRDPNVFNTLPESIKANYDAPERKTLQKRLIEGRAIDWQLLHPLLEIPQDKGEGEYRSPTFEHGTHVAGVLGAEWKSDDNGNEQKIDIQGICPNIRLYDLRVLDENGESDEFSILAALQFVQYLNANSDHQLLHGVNLSLSIRNNVRNFGCGCTPVCEESERLVKAGLVVVAAAGNDGYIESEQYGGGFSEGYKSISITDPGNAEGVITVGSTHRDHPHTYGVSYFSSRGPTGDGRIKPDLVAPGEKITSLIPGGGLKSMDGTSMAAPHVSGAAALLMARYSELIGKPERVKQILCSTATDLGRERYFQGYGMLDILRAMQSV